MNNLRRGSLSFLIIILLMLTMIYYSIGIIDKYDYSEAIFKLTDRQCTAFAISPTIALSAAHCYSGPLMNAKLKNLNFKVQIISLDRFNDIMVLKTINFKFLSFLKLANNLPNDKIELKQQGFPRNSSNLIEQNIIIEGSSVTKMPFVRDGKLTMKPNTVYSLRGCIISGMSGSPVYNPKTGIVYSLLSISTDEINKGFGSIFFEGTF